MKNNKMTNRFFYDTEFLEGTQVKRFCGIPYGKTPNTIDLISIGIISEDNREYYAISKDFNLKEAWNRYQMKETSPAKKYMGFYEEREYWIRDNVLLPIFFELADREFHDIHFKDEWTFEGNVVTLDVFKSNWKWRSNYKWFKKLINKYGKTNKQISEEAKNFIYQGFECSNEPEKWGKELNIELYSYYGAYDHVVLCWLFGKMIDLPKFFPMYSRDLKQMLDEKEVQYNRTVSENLKFDPNNIYLKKHIGYPKQENAHNALDDAHWNKKLYEFLNNLQ